MSTQLSFFEPDLKVFTTIQGRFEEFHRLNPWVYRRLVSLARDLRRKGMQHMGIGMLWEVLRWHYYHQTLDPNSRWALNDHYRSRYSRLIMKQETDLARVFELRQLTAK